MDYTAAADRYTNGMKYNRCGAIGALYFRPSHWVFGIILGDIDNQEEAEKMILYALDHGITHIDIANNYGPPPGSAESNFGKIFKKQLQGYRDELIISSKAGYLMWPGPYGEWGIPQVPACQHRSKPQAHRTRILRCILQSPVRSQHTA